MIPLLPLRFSNLFHFATAKVSEKVLVSDRFQRRWLYLYELTGEWFGDMEERKIMLREYIQRHKDWSQSTFGSGQQTEKICNHIAKELIEIRAKPDDLYEWIDIIILAIDGAWRAGFSPVQIINALITKQAVNFEREWNLGNGNEPNEHKKNPKY